MDDPGCTCAGPNSADIKGELGVGVSWKSDAAIDAPVADKCAAVTGRHGKRNVKVRGTVEAPQLLADITARGLRWQELPVARARIECGRY